jgi:hypothetical protein
MQKNNLNLDPGAPRYTRRPGRRIGESKDKKLTLALMIKKHHNDHILILTKYNLEHHHAARRAIQKVSNRPCSRTRLYGDSFAEAYP